MFKFSIGRRGLAAFAAALALSPLAGGCALAKPAAACTPQPTLRQEPLEIVTAQGVAKFTVELADTPGRQETGMMCRTSLAPDRGMLFDFGQPTDDVAFWMRNTLIGLDIVYIAPNGTILSIARHARPLDETPIPAGGTIRAVLEIADGRAAQLGLKPGDKVVHRIFAR